jgi:hypothetical protein
VNLNALRDLIEAAELADWYNTENAKVLKAAQDAYAAAEADAQSIVTPLDLAWEQINSLGGVVQKGDEVGEAENAAIGAALVIIESLGGGDPLPKRARAKQEEERAAVLADGGPENGGVSPVERAPAPVEQKPYNVHLMLTLRVPYEGIMAASPGEAVRTAVAQFEIEEETSIRERGDLLDGFSEAWVGIGTDVFPYDALAIELELKKIDDDIAALKPEPCGHA